VTSFDEINRTFTFEYISDLALLTDMQAAFTDYTITILANSGIKVLASAQ